jgi:hypothetical protein
MTREEVERFVDRELAALEQAIGPLDAAERDRWVAPIWAEWEYAQRRRRPLAALLAWWRPN